MNTDKCPLTWEEIEAMPTGTEKCRMLLNYASDAMRLGDDYKAVTALSEAIVQVSWKILAPTYLCWRLHTRVYVHCR